VAHEELLDAIAHELNRRTALSFGRILEAAYEAREGADRRARLAMGLRVVAWCSLGAIVPDLVDGMGSLPAILGWRFTEAALAALGSIVLRRTSSPSTETLWITVGSVGMAVVNTMVGMAGPPRFADRYVEAAAVCVAGFLGLIPARVPSGVVAAFASIIAYTLVLAVASGPMPLATNWDMPVFALGAFAVSLLNIGLKETRRRITFLQQLRYELTAEQMTALNAELLRHASTDLLTGLANRRRFEAEARRVWNERADLGLGVLLIDVDRFKSFNDTAGHEAGDICLQEVARAVASALRRQDDLAARYGGEEFVVLLPAISADDAVLVAERLRAAVEARALPHPGLGGRPVTISVGLAWRDAAARTEGLQDLLREADTGLYAAKAAGRNRVAVPALAQHASA
jgi:diguanylate cyclase (GGDEF)-like protein